MKKTPDETACDWVRHRLPLLAEGEDEPAPDAESAPARAERLAVEDHLDACGDCRDRRDRLAQALDLLGAAAAESPVEPHVPSLWPALQARIEEQAEARARRAGRRRSGAAAKSPLERAASRLNGVRDDLPLQLAWIGDTAREDSTARVRASAGLDRLLRSLASPAGALAAAALLAIAVGLPLASRHRDQAEARIVAASDPLPILVRPAPLDVSPILADSIEQPDGLLGSEPVDLSDDDRILAQNTEPPLQPDGLTVDVPKSRPTPSPAVRFDLERGTPMPPDSRIDKPAY